MTGNGGAAGFVHVARQPIVDARGALVGYELLFRHAATAGAASAAGDAATTATILAAFAEFDPAQLLAGRPGFVNLTRAFLTGALPVPFLPRVAVLEVLETVEVDAEVVDGVRCLADRGFTIALDDFVWSHAAEPLLEVAHIVKVDVLGQAWYDVLATVERCRRPGVRLLAERIEDEQVFARCRDAGFELFQGYHLGRPQTHSRATLNPSQASAVQLLARLSEPETTAADVEAILRGDPALTYRLLRIANSSAYGLRRSVGTLRDAVIVIGLARLRSWIVLLTLPELVGDATVLTAALLRARTCENLVRTGGAGAPDTAFALGLLDGLADALGVTGAEFVDMLPALAPPLAAALRGEPTRLGEVLRAVRAYERDAEGSWGTGSGLAGIAPDVVARVAAAHLAALAWTGRGADMVDRAGQE